MDKLLTIPRKNDINPSIIEDVRISATYLKYKNFSRLDFCLSHGVMEYWNIGMLGSKGNFFFDLFAFHVNRNIGNDNSR